MTTAYHSPQGKPSTDLPHASHDRVLLGVDEALQHHTNGHVDIIVVHILPQMHLCVGFCAANDGFDVPHSDWDAASPLREYNRTGLLKMHLVQHADVHTRAHMYVHMHTSIAEVAHHRLLPQFSVQLGDLVLVHLMQLRVHPFLCIHNVLPEEVLGNGLHTRA